MNPTSAPPATSTIGYGMFSMRASTLRPTTAISRPAMRNSASPIVLGKLDGQLEAQGLEPLFVRQAREVADAGVGRRVLGHHVPLARQVLRRIAEGRGPDRAGGQRVD